MSDVNSGAATAATSGSQPLSIFDVKPENFASFAKPDWGQRTEFFDPKPDKAADKIYRAVIRILPNIHQPSIPVAIIRYYWFGDGQSGFRYNTPSSPNMHPANPEDLMKPIGWCPVSDLFWRLKRSGDAQQEQIAVNNFSMQSNYICMVQIKNDQAHPENNGKILPYKLPAAIYKRIQSAMNPTAEDIKMGQVPMDVFHPVKGHDILLKITLKDVNGQMMRDYEVCTIAPKPSSLMIDGAVADINKYDSDPAYAQEVQQKIVALLNEQPDVDKEYGYKEATDDVKRKVKQILSRYEDVADIWPELSIAQGAQTGQAAQPAQPAINPFAPQPAPAAQPAQTVEQPAVQPAPAADPFAATAEATAAFVAGLNANNKA